MARISVPTVGPEAGEEEEEGGVAVVVGVADVKRRELVGMQARMVTGREAGLLGGRGSMEVRTSSSHKNWQKLPESEKLGNAHYC